MCFVVDKLGLSLHSSEIIYYIVSFSFDCVGCKLKHIFLPFMQELSADRLSSLCCLVVYSSREEVGKN
jgi:hypothetical protein